MSQEWDVIVVGAGSAGLPAAIRAAEGGARVLQIEADRRIGGTLHWSSGQMAAAGTRQQQAAGIEDSPGEHYDDAQRITGGTIDPELGRLAIDNAADTIDWLCDLGYQPSAGTPAPGVTHEPYTVRRYVWGDKAGISVLETLEPRHRELVSDGKIELRLGHRMTGIERDGGRVSGVRVASEDDGDYVAHGGAVALTSGGYAANPELWSELTPSIPLRSFCNPYARGEGVTAALELGAKVDGSEHFLCTFAGYLEDPHDPLSVKFFSIAPKHRPPWEIFVDGDGARFMREDEWSIDYCERALLAQPGMRMWIVYDERIRQNAPPLTLPDDTTPEQLMGKHPRFVRADSVADLAAATGMNAETLQASIDQFNQAVAAGEDGAFGRKHLVRPIAHPPYYAVEAAGVTVCSPAGLAIDTQLRVLNEEAEPIEGLYAAGEVCGFCRFTGNAFVGGMSLTPALTLGRLLGERLAAAT